MPFIIWGNSILLQILGKGPLPNYGQSTRLKNKLIIPNLGFQSLYANIYIFFVFTEVTKCNSEKVL